jgi:hypothetical protein
LEYNRDLSDHEGFYVDGDYVIFIETISVRNNTDTDLFFFMQADYPDDRKLVYGGSIMAYEENSMKLKEFFIKANSIASYEVYFKGVRGERSTKRNRLPPSSINFVDLRQDGI